MPDNSLPHVVQPEPFHVDDVESLAKNPKRDRFEEQCFAALDLGTNNCRLLIATPYRQGFRVVDAFSRVVRLGEGLGTSGRLSETAQDRALAALKICSDKVKRRNVHMARHVATQACRSASNCQEFVARVYEETGLHLDVISPAEEARLAVLGCQTLFDRNAKAVLVFDIGGGSTELIFARPQGLKPAKVESWVSIPWGVVSLAEKFGVGDVSPENYQAMRETLMPTLEKFIRDNGLHEASGFHNVQLLGTSGTVTTLTGLHLGLPFYDRKYVDGADVPSHALRDLAANLAAMDFATRAQQPCIGTERADLVVAGCAILHSILSAVPETTVRVADRGIREGVLRTLMTRDHMMSRDTRGTRK
jgi:exopolyphosphatase / guanosine-5'-triphosphate,3'-diphosphate pyrophosphatase